jgi:hypothetical protein
MDSERKDGHSNPHRKAVSIIHFCFSYHRHLQTIGTLIAFIFNFVICAWGHGQ